MVSVVTELIWTQKLHLKFQEAEHVSLHMKQHISLHICKRSSFREDKSSSPLQDTCSRKCNNDQFDSNLYIHKLIQGQSRLELLGVTSKFFRFL